MKIAIIDYYSEASSIHKDPITIPLALSALGCDVDLVSRYDVKFSMLLSFDVYPLKNWINIQLYKYKYDAVIAISRFDSKLTDDLIKIKDLNIPLIIKGDTDGTIGYPLTPNYLRTKPILKSPVNIFRHIKWRSRFSKAVKEKILQIKLADLVVCESPLAKENLEKVFDYWSLDKNKIAFIPNPVSDICLKKNISPSKTKTIVSIGRWDDIDCKGSDLLAKVIDLVQKEIEDFQFIIIGNFPENLKKLVLKSGQSKVLFKGPLEFEQTQQILSKAQVLLVPSRLESFSLVSAEALCWGTSIVVTPIESLRYLAGEGDFGTISADFQAQSIKEALVTEVNKWMEATRNPNYISNYWRNDLSKISVGDIWKKNLEKTINEFKSSKIF